MQNRVHDSRAIANIILDLAAKDGLSLTLMQLIKLVYIAHGWSLALLQRPLISTHVEAWQYGPVIPQVYGTFKGSGSAPISARATNPSTGLPFVAELDENQHSLVGSVVRNYGRLHAFQLSNLMHQPGTPWTEIYGSTGPYSVIPDQLIGAHFNDIRASRAV